jgi:PAS domain S-box-containing protein
VVYGVITIDEYGLIESFNIAAEKIFGYHADEIIGKNIKLLLPNSLVTYWQPQQSKIIGRNQEVLGQRKDRTIFPVELAISEFYLGQRRMFTGVLRDITESKQLEKQLQQSQKLEAIGRLAGGIAHDFNNILMAITGDCELILSDLPNNSLLYEEIGQIKENADRGAALTKQLLAFGRKLVVKPTVLNLNTVIINVEKLLRRLIGEDIELVTRTVPELGQVKADAGQIEQVVMNLAINARDAMPQGGTLTIETGNVEITPQNSFPDLKPGSYVTLTVRDTGTGIPAHDLPYIFEPFFTTKEVGKGTGLGLATVHGIVRQAGGHIDVDSQINRGTAFIMYLPQSTDSITDSTTGSSSHSQTEFGNKSNVKGEETILLVEDEASVRLVVQKLLNKSGYNVLTAGYGQEAINKFREYAGTIDLLVTDVIMPQGMTGRELAEHLLSEHPDIKILFMSGYTDDIVSPQDLMRPGMAFLQKPFALDELARKVKDMLEV